MSCFGLGDQYGFCRKHKRQPNEGRRVGEFRNYNREGLSDGFVKETSLCQSHKTSQVAVIFKMNPRPLAAKSSEREETNYTRPSCNISFTAHEEEGRE